MWLEPKSGGWESVFAMKISAGSDVDIWCTKCKANAVGTVVAMVDTEIAQVTCKICGSGPKKYRAAKGKGAAEVAKKSAVKAKSTRSTRQPSKPLLSYVIPVSTGAVEKAKAERKEALAAGRKADSELWLTKQELLKGKSEVYDTHNTYTEGTIIDHSRWGLGIVEAVRGEDRIEVLFAKGRKLLVMSLRI